MANRRGLISNMNGKQEGIDIKYEWQTGNFDKLKSYACRINSATVNQT